MAQITILGGCGAVGSIAVKALANNDEYSEIILADIDEEKAREIVSDIGSEKVRAMKVDVMDPKSLKKSFEGSNVILNCTGPFYKFVKPILKAVIESGINYLDICDDVDVTLEILEMDQEAKDAGITALIGMGNSPGITNLLAKFAADDMLDEIDAIDIYHAHGGEPTEGEGVIGHRFHCMSIDIPMFLDGKMTTVKFFEEDGIALQEDVDFHLLGDKIRVYPYPHPEQVTLPNYIKADRVTNKGTVLPDEYYELIKDICRLGMGDKEPIAVKECEISPYDFATAYIIKQREKILKETGFGSQRGCVKIVATGTKDGEYRQFVFQLASKSQALGEGTGIPAAIGAILMNRGKITEKGVLPPEGCVNPLDFIGMIQSVAKRDKDEDSFEVIIESIDKDGNVQRLSL